MTNRSTHATTSIVRSHLSDAKLVILSKAAQRSDGRIERPSRFRGGAADKVIAALLAKSLIEPVSADHLERRERSAIGTGRKQENLTDYRISNAGLAAIVIAGEDGEDGEDGVAWHAREDADLSPASVSGGGGVASSNLPRTGRKQGQLIALLTREEGASIVEIATALGWLPHTTRAALTGLRRRGYELGRETDGARGSIYRIIMLPITTPPITTMPITAPNMAEGIGTKAA